MFTLALIVIPAAAGLAAFLIRPNPVRRLLLLLAAAMHAAMTVLAWRWSPVPGIPGWLELDSLGLFFLFITSVLFLLAAIYAVGYLQREQTAAHQDVEEHVLFVNAPEAVFTGCLLLFLATMTLVCASRRFGLLWVAIEATTLASAPLIYYHRHHRSLEATWKYLLICSVGIALALPGNFFLAAAALAPGGASPALTIERLMQLGPSLQPVWLKAAFIFFLVGYGTKTGLAPLHTWLPDAHSEAPSVVSALLSGALLNCAFLGILRAYQVCVAAGLGDFTRELLVVFGLFSLAVAAVFILGQRDFKRMLAYSSVEHMGILALGIGIGGGAAYGAMLHALNHSLAKGMLFLLAGNILALYQTKIAADVRGVIRLAPVTGILWVAGLFAITGSPPFGLFISEWLVLTGAVAAGQVWIAVVFLVLLALIFCGMSAIMLRMAQGTPTVPNIVASPARESFLGLLPPLVLAGAVLMLGIVVPPALDQVLRDIMGLLGG